MNTAVSPLSTVDNVPARSPSYLCFPPAGGTVLGLRGLARTSAASAVWGVEYPGHGERLTEAPGESLAGLADGIALECLARFGAEGFSRTVLIGFSMGAFVALEVAQRVVGRGRPGPAGLVVVGACAPQRRFPGKYAKTDTAEARRLLERSSADYHDFPELREYALDLFLGDLRLTSAYPGPASVPLSCPVVAIRGADDPDFATGDEEIWAWRAWTTGRFTGHVVPGGHLAVLTPGEEARFWELVRSGLEPCDD
ncbi:thioesterase [Amycolatopsis sp. WAC 04169]|uniref:thioesterase II family protein n=1 Tax=Amycolatopsis sp. WAC 04169 TaxID=2203197 RepID=UPI000F7711B6|nr:alpha/beta fold hydrolase [Amycolatopsis sp. WAC 04169]RSN33043.1 thioesterase [Amycolatopsis sp. WAC 04169]